MAQNQQQAPKIDQILQNYVENISQFVNNNITLTKSQLDVLNKMNMGAAVHYEKNLDKVVKIKEEMNQTNQMYDNLKTYFKKIEQIGQSIEGMESSAEYLCIILDRIENKLNELEKM